MSLTNFQKNEIPINRINSYNSKNTPQNGVNIEKDDTKGDLKGNDNKDNEWAILNQPELQTDNLLIPVIYKYNDLKWEDLSHLEFRIYTGGPNEVKNLINFQDLKKSQFEDGEILIPGKIFNKNNNWYFDTCSNNEKIELLLKIKSIHDIKDLDKWETALDTQLPECWVFVTGNSLIDNKRGWKTDSLVSMYAFRWSPGKWLGSKPDNSII